MRSRLCILETIKTLKMILDSAMASKMKNIYHKKLNFFTRKMVFIQKNLIVFWRNQTLYPNLPLGGGELKSGHYFLGKCISGPFSLMLEQNNKLGVKGQCTKKQKFHRVFLGSAKILCHIGCVKWPKGPKMDN